MPSIIQANTLVQNIHVGSYMFHLCNHLNAHQRETIRNTQNIETTIISNSKSTFTTTSKSQNRYSSDHNGHTVPPALRSPHPHPPRHRNPPPPAPAPPRPPRRSLRLRRDQLPRKLPMERALFPLPDRRPCRSWLAIPRPRHGGLMRFIRNSRLHRERVYERVISRHSERDAGV